LLGLDVLHLPCMGPDHVDLAILVPERLGVVPFELEVHRIGP
jgi:hypothetical protein